MVPIPRGSTAYKVAARESAPSGELPSNRHDEREPVQSQYHLTCGRDRCWPLDGNARHLSKKKERDIMQSLTPKAPYKGKGMFSTPRPCSACCSTSPALIGSSAYCPKR